MDSIELNRIAQSFLRILDPDPACHAGRAGRAGRALKVLLSSSDPKENQNRIQIQIQQQDLERQS